MTMPSAFSIDKCHINKEGLCFLYPLAVTNILTTREWWGVISVCFVFDLEFFTEIIMDSPAA